MQTNSTFTVDTSQAGFGSKGAQPNKLHEFYHSLLPAFSQECPYLSKLVFLQLVLRENFLIHTQARVDAKDVWLSISRALQLSKPQIYVLDERVSSEEVLATQDEYSHIMLLSVAKMQTQLLNRLLNLQSSISLMGIEDPAMEVGPHIADLFALIGGYEHAEKISHLVDLYNSKINNEAAMKFDTKGFNEAVNFNFEVVLLQKEDQGFVRPFLSLLEHQLQRSGVSIPQSKWKKMARILKFLGINKQEGVFKKIALGDFVLAGELLASSFTQLKLLHEQIQQALVSFVPYYSTYKFQKSIHRHFWFSRQHELLAQRVLETVDADWVSFLYPCSKFPDCARLLIDEVSLQPYYRIEGHDKKLMSDHHCQVEANHGYKLCLQVAVGCDMILQMGLACYDHNKTAIDSQKGSIIQTISLQKSEANSWLQLQRTYNTEETPQFPPGTKYIRVALMVNTNCQPGTEVASVFVFRHIRLGKC